MSYCETSTGSYLPKIYSEAPNRGDSKAHNEQYV